MVSAWLRSKSTCSSASVVPASVTLSKLPSIIAAWSDSKLPIMASGNSRNAATGTLSLSITNSLEPPSEIVFPSTVAIATVAPSSVMTTSSRKISAPSSTTRISWVSVLNTLTVPLIPIIFPTTIAIPCSNKYYSLTILLFKHEQAIVPRDDINVERYIFKGIVILMWVMVWRVNLITLLTHQ